MAKNYSTYSLSDTKTVVRHPKVGRKNVAEQHTISDEGGGKVTIAYASDMSSHTATANGYVIVNKMRVRNGTVTMEVPQNSAADLFLRRLVKYVDNAVTSQFALTTITVEDKVSGKKYSCAGCTPQKRPDVAYDQTAGTISYAFLCAEITES